MKKPTASELAILNVLWEFGPSTVKFVNEKLSEKKPIGYTTTLKMMQMMFEKKMLIRKKESRSHVYDSANKKEDMQADLYDRFLESTFGGSAKKLIMHALGRKNSSKEELSEIKKFLESLDD